jgi:hypothetical protein
MKVAETEKAHRAIAIDAISVAVLIAYFLHFALPALRGGFRGDEMMNMTIYWDSGMLKSLLANVTFWTTFYRPGGALYYLSLYHLFALDPLPYRIVQISILAASIPLVYYLSRCLTSSRSVAFLAVLALCYHPGLANLVFVGAFIYDVLCGFFYFAALTYYIHIREKEQRLRPLQVLGFLGLYVCALNSKEMAVTLPVIVLVYELLKRPRWADWKAFFCWCYSLAAPSLIAGLVTAIYIYGKTHGGGSLTRYDPYRPKVSWHHFTASNAKFVSDLLYFQHAITPITLLVLWAAVFIYAFLRRDRTLQLMAFWVVIVPLPLAFLVPLRAGASLYLLLFGWAMIFAMVIVDLITLISKSRILVGQGVGAGAAAGAIVGGALRSSVRDAAIGAAAGAAVGKMSASTFRIVAVLLVASGLAIFTRWENQRHRTAQVWLSVGEKVPRVIEALKSLHLQPRSQSTVLLRIPENLFLNKSHAVFIAYLVWNDHSLGVWLENANALTPQQLAKVDYIVFLNEFEAKVIRSPEIPQSD